MIYFEYFEYFEYYIEISEHKMSSALFSNQPQFNITMDIFNTILNIMNSVNGGAQETPFSLFPSLSGSRFRTAYQNIINEPNFTLHFVHILSEFRFFFLKMGGRVYQIITDSQVTDVYQASQVQFF